MINHGNRGVPSCRIQISTFSYECPVSCPSTVHEPPKLESHHNDNQSPPPPPLKGNSRHMPGESLHAAAPSQCLVIITIIIINIIIIILLLITIIIRLDIRIFRHPFSKYPTVQWKWQVRASIGTAKSDIGVCANTDRVFFPHTMRVSDNIPPNGSLNRLSDDQPWQSWGALFSDPDISVQLWMSSFMPVHGSWTTQAGVTSQRQSEL